MKTLNLANHENSDINYTITKFPDGQQQIKIFNLYESVEIKSRLNSWMDLEVIVLAVKALRGMGTKSISLYVPYFIGSRSDRKFEHGSTNYIKDVISPVINSLNIDSISTLDAHSDVLEACLNNHSHTKLDLFYRWACSNINNKQDAQEMTLFMSPDAGAMKKIYKIAETLYYKGKIITCSKHRDISGNITKTDVPHFDITKDVFLFDDICDGGRTFVEIGKVIKERHENYDREKEQKDHGKLYLIVTHGIFSKGLKELSQYFDGIYTTNSYQDIDSMSDFGMRNEKYLHLIKQFNLF